GSVKATTTIEVIRNPITNLSVEPKTARGRTGEVLRFKAIATGEKGAPISSPAVRWAVSGDGAFIEADGGFVAEKAGSYAVTAVSGDRAAVATVTISPREVAREFEVVGRAPQEEFQAAEEWIIGNYAYVTSIMAGRLWVYDISNSSKPVKVDSVPFD